MNPSPNSLSSLTAAVLVGGRGTRLRPVVSDRPKILVEILNKPFLAYLLDQLAAVKIRKVVLCTGYMAESVRNTFGTSYSGLNLVYSHESRPLGTGGALRLALPLLEADTVLAMNGDSYCEADLAAFAEWHRQKKADISILLAKLSDTKRFGRVRIDPAARVIQFEEKDGPPGPGTINAGVYCLKRSVLETITPNRKVSLEREFFPSRVGKELYGYEAGKRFIDIGTPEAYASAEKFFRSIHSE